MLKKSQLTAIQLMIYSDKSDDAIAKEVGVNPSTLWRWKQTEEFQGALVEENRRKFKDLQKEALKTMENLVKRGNFQAAKYILDGNSYAPTEKHDVQVDAKIEIDYGE